MSVEADIPFVSGPLVNANGTVTQVWWAFFRQLWVRTGSGPGISAEDLEMLGLLQGNHARIQPDPSAQFLPPRAAARPRDATDANLFALMLFSTLRSRLLTAVLAPSVTLTASEALNAGDPVSFWNSSGAKVRRADATDDSKQADGFVKLAVGIGAPAIIYPTGVNDAVTGLTPAALQFLAVGGGYTATPPSASGNWLQQLGRAADATHLPFSPTAGTLL